MENFKIQIVLAFHIDKRGLFGWSIFFLLLQKPLNLWCTHEEKGSITHIKLFTIKGKAKKDSTLVITKRCLLGFAYSNVPAQIIWFFMMISTEQADLQTTDSVLVFTRGAVLVLFGLLTLLELGGTTTVIFLWSA